MPTWLFLTLWAFALGSSVAVYIKTGGPCDCGRSRKWYFRASHERGASMLWDFLLVAGFSLITIAFLDYGAVVWAMWAVWSWRRYWFHEKDKIKKAARALGRVVIKDNGRLAVQQ